APLARARRAASRARARGPAPLPPRPGPRRGLLLPRHVRHVDPVASAAAERARPRDRRDRADTRGVRLAAARRARAPRRRTALGPGTVRDRPRRGRRRRPRAQGLADHVRDRGTAALMPPERFWDRADRAGGRLRRRLARRFIMRRTYRLSGRSRSHW